MFVCTRCRALDKSAKKPWRCARCCFIGTMIDQRLLEVREQYRRRTGTDDTDDYDDDFDDEDEIGDVDDDEEYEYENEDDDFRPGYVRPVDMSKVTIKSFKRVQTGWPAFDHVMGGGLIRGFIYLLGGAAGAGKSTFCLQVGHAIQARTHYVSAEEDKNQIARRMRRVKPRNEIKFARTKDIETALNIKNAPELLVIDSLQKFRHRGHLGSMTHVAVMNEIETFTRRTGCITIVLSRINKAGRFAGRNDLDHDSDATLQFEVPGKDTAHKDQNDQRRYLKINKNREGTAPQMIECRMESKGIVFADLPPSKAIPSAPREEKAEPKAASAKTKTTKPKTAVRAHARPSTRATLDKSSRNSSKRTVNAASQSRGKSVNSKQIKGRARASAKG